MPTGNVEPEDKPAICVVVAPVQLSTPTGAVYVTTAPHSPVVLFTVIFAGHTIFGGSTSTTVTVNEHSAVKFEPSVTRNLFVVTPTGKVEPEVNPSI